MMPPQHNSGSGDFQTTKNSLSHKYNFSTRRSSSQIHNLHPHPRSPPSPKSASDLSLRNSSMGKKEMEVVKGVDLKRYMGRWYEIASFPSRFQPRNGANTRATYTLRDERTVNVLNETWVDGKRGFIEGTAVKANPASDEAKLKVKFYVPPFMPIIPVVGDYWVLHLDDDYQYALIGQPSRSYLWILCRQTHLDEEIYNQLVEKAKEHGYDVSKLRRTTHTDSPPDGEEGPKDNKGMWWIKSIFGK